MANLIQMSMCCIMSHKESYLGKYYNAERTWAGSRKGVLQLILCDRVCGWRPAQTTLTSPKLDLEFSLAI